MADQFISLTAEPDAPAIGAYVVAPSNTADLPDPVRAVTIGGDGGTISFVSSRDAKTYTTGPLPVGTYPLFASRIRVTGTTATGLTGWI